MSTTEKLPEPTPKLRKTWDKRTWIVGSLGSLIMSTLVIPDSQVKDDTNGPAFYLAMIGFAGCWFVMPPILAGIAKRRWLLWPYFSVLILVAVSFIANLVGTMRGIYPTKGPDSATDVTTTAFVTGLIFLLICPMLLALPVILFRWIMARRRFSVLKFEQVNAIAPPGEGVWPPPPGGNVT